MVRMRVTAHSTAGLEQAGSCVAAIKFGEQRDDCQRRCQWLRPFVRLDSTIRSFSTYGARKGRRNNFERCLAKI